jgi:hypothetical protein
MISKFFPQVPALLAHGSAHSMTNSLGAVCLNDLFTLRSESPYVQFNCGGPYCQAQIPRAIVNELLEDGLITPISDPTKPANQVFRITEKGRNCLVNGIACSADGL